MDKIILKNLSFYGYHGVLPEENKLGQKFFVDIELFCDLLKPGKTDGVDDTVNYAEVFNLVKKIVEEKQYNLIEALAHDIASSILLDFKLVKEVNVVIKKPEAPVPGIYDYFGVEIRRKRNG